MKKLAKILLILLGITYFNTAYMVEEDPYVGKSNIEKTILMGKYLNGHRENIINFANKYELLDDQDINKYIEKIDFLIDSLNKIQSNNFDKDREDLLISTILNEIKKTNEQLKVVLIIKKNNFEKDIKVKKEMYSKIANKLSIKILEIHNLLYNDELKNKKILSENEVRLKNALNKIENLSKRLKYFSYIEFEKPSQIKDEFLYILKQIKEQINIIKKNM
ncbi:hypothetical protein HUU51_04515 [Candidatus Gracilibacteria bacterium]|nr:hypothetical protein [Candidatus Gracilibacteria bacterium]